MDGVPATEVGFRRAETWNRSSDPWWFAQWLCALTADQVAMIVDSKLAAHRAGAAVPDSVTLVTFDLASGSPVATWADRRRHDIVPWLDLWDRLNTCGEASWHQLVRLPASLLQDRLWVQHRDLAGLLADAVNRDDDLVTLSSDADGGFSPLPEPPLQDVAGDDRDAAADDDRGQNPDHRIVAFLDVEALRLG